jgi:hypothetical protein
MTPEQIDRAFYFWIQRFRRYLHYDDDIRPYLDLRIDPNRRPWLRSARRALHIPANLVAKNLRCSRSAYYKLEFSELKGTISLNSLRAAAKTIDCELVYAIRPRQRKTFSQVIWDKWYPSWVRSPEVAGAPEFQMGKERTLARLVFKAMENRLKYKRRF